MDGSKIVSMTEKHLRFSDSLNFILNVLERYVKIFLPHM
jgi:hypothetical protein